MKRRTFIKSAALLSIASAVPAYSNTPQVCSALTNNIDTAKGEAVALISDLHINDDPLIAEFTTALQNIKRRGINNIIRWVWRTGPENKNAAHAAAIWNLDRDTVI
ncbi:hypothetical protein [Yokenella regensburgei]|uniref:hypothetical protein n=1 Tax=Yokenella regensburgei TaxID=158877 RepID=UPI001FE66A4F|nr:hypothetical protein [Yokenella regensburgei]